MMKMFEKFGLKAVGTAAEALLVEEFKDSLNPDDRQFIEEMEKQHEKDDEKAYETFLETDDGKRVRKLAAKFGVAKMTTNVKGASDKKNTHFFLIMKKLFEAADGV